MKELLSLQKVAIHEEEILTSLVLFVKIFVNFHICTSSSNELYINFLIIIISNVNLLI